MSVLFCTCAVKIEYQNCLNVFKSEVYLAVIKSGSVYSISVLFFFFFFFLDEHFKHNLTNGKETSYYGNNQVAKRLESERCEKYRVANSPVINVRSILGRHRKVAKCP